MTSLRRKEILDFQKTVWSYYKTRGRKLPWRPPVLKIRKDKFLDPYKVLVSEVMLQQTQVSRVILKYPLFIKRFPTIHALSRARFGEVLRLWSGLGYNRRARFLYDTARAIVSGYQGAIPREMDALAALPGIGKGTAGAILAFAFNKPAVFIETNIRAAYIYYFFQSIKLSARHSDIRKNVGMSCGGGSWKSARGKIHDKELLPLIGQTLDKTNSREWYYALMDYGAMLKSRGENPNRKSAQYVRQSAFVGSHRQLRGRVLAVCIAQSPLTLAELAKILRADATKIKKIIAELTKERLIQFKNRQITIAR